MGGKTYLLTIDDEDLFIMLEDVNWSYLKEIFEEVMPWSENVVQVERATWLEISGLPLYCWNHITIKRIAELWGTFEASGENINHTKDCEKVTVLISTDYERRIEELVQVEVGEIIYRVRVLEIGFSDDSKKVFQVKKNEGLNDVEDLVGESSSELERRIAFHRSTEKDVDEQNRNLPVLHKDRVIEGTLSEVEVEDWVSSSEFEENFSITERVFFPELESKRDTNKCYGSLMSL
ncbi:hypothetical protein V6N13_017243 [Hibiscus sabdariffa]